MYKKILMSSILSISLIGCASLEWRNVHNYNNENVNLKIDQYYEDIKNPKSGSANISIQFDSDSFKYPYKLKKFYHLIHILNQSEKKAEMFSVHKITKESDNYQVLVEFDEKQNIKYAIEYVLSSIKITKDLKQDILYNIEDEKKREAIEKKKSKKYIMHFFMERDKKKMTIDIKEYNEQFHGEIERKVI